MSTKKYGLNDKVKVNKETRLYYFRKNLTFVELNQGLMGNLLILKNQFDLGFQEGIFCTFPHTKVIRSNGNYDSFIRKVRSWMTDNDCQGVLENSGE